jgi:hypothetical protein
MAKQMYCSRCRDSYGHHIARKKFGTDIFRNVKILSKRGPHSSSAPAKTAAMLGFQNLRKRSCFTPHNTHNQPIKEKVIWPNNLLLKQIRSDTILIAFFLSNATMEKIVCLILMYVILILEYSKAQITNMASKSQITK